MLLYFFVSFVLYYGFMAWVLHGWNSLTNDEMPSNPSDPIFVSVVIAVRNEEKNMPGLLSSLTLQSYPHDQFEVIFVDDGSTDHTVGYIEKYQKKASFFMIVMENKYSPNQKITPKKAALMKGVEASKGEVILMTDGDCWFGKKWLESMALPFANKNTMFVSGPVALAGKDGLFANIQTMEFASLIGTGAAMIAQGYPLMCNGANLAFRKDAFHAVNGYHGFEGSSSGDDVFLMQKIHAAFRGSIVFQKTSKSMIYTAPQNSLKELIHQRKRWASKWNQYLLLASWVLPVLLFMHYVTIIVGIFLAIAMPSTIWGLGIFMGIKIFLDYIFLKKVMYFCNLRFQFWVFALCEFLYPIYALFMGISVHFGDYQWKGRTHKTR